MFFAKSLHNRKNVCLGVTLDAVTNKSHNVSILKLWRFISHSHYSLVWSQLGCGWVGSLLHIDIPVEKDSASSTCIFQDSRYQVDIQMVQEKSLEDLCGGFCGPSLEVERKAAGSMV